LERANVKQNYQVYLRPKLVKSKIFMNKIDVYYENATLKIPYHQISVKLNQVN